MDGHSILLAPDKFKGALSASAVASSLKAGLESTLPVDCELREHPLADGGEGTVESIVRALDGTFRTTSVRGPLGEIVEAEWGTVEYEGNDTAVIEMAAASGYDLIDPEEANPLEATTYGTGQLIEEALQEDVDHVIVGLGGSATVDGGLGMARALGFEFRDSEGRSLEKPKALDRLASVDTDGVPDALRDVSVTVLSDVDNPLLGENGAANVYGPQKGADHAMVRTLEENLTHWADVLEEQLSVRARNEEGAGAAGGLGFGLATLLDGTLVSGAQTVMDVTNFNSAVESVDVLITGEGAIDRQTQYGKTPVAAARRAREHGSATVVAVCGQRSDGYDELYDDFDVILSVLDRPMSLEEAIGSSDDLLWRTGRDLGHLLMSF